jgi:5-methylthioadenosine/S-adenosylhomocysteine deaminase
MMLEQTRNLLVREGLLILKGDGGWTTETGDVRVRAGQIIQIAPAGSLSPRPDENVLGARGKLVMPGLVNGHHHSYSNLYRMPVADAPLEMWIVRAMMARASATERAYYVAALLASIQLLQAGVTTVLDQITPRSGSLDAVARAYQEVGLRSVIAPEISDLKYYDALPHKSGGEPLPGKLEWEMEPPRAEDLLELCSDFAERWHSEPRLSVMLAPSAPQRCSDELLRGTRELAERLDIGVHMHLLETRVQKQVANERFAGSTVRYLDDLGLVTERTSFAHALFLSDEEMEIVAERGASVVHNPVSNLLLGSGIFPLSRYRAVGVNVGLGTDGPNCSGTQNIFENMKLAVMLQRVTEPEPAAWLSPAEALHMATTGGSAAVNLQRSVGAIEVGRRADLVVLGLNRPALVPLYDAIAQLVLSEQGQSVETVVVDGEVVLQDGRCTRIDEASVLGEAEACSVEIRAKLSDRATAWGPHVEAARRLWRSALAEMPLPTGGIGNILPE